jgi:inosine/xanthosine triphosphatase
MKTVIVGSENPIKLATTKEAFTIAFPHEEFTFVTFAAKSDVPDQPMGIAETKLGAMNRASHCRVVYAQADFFVGLEGGLEEIENEFWVSAWMCVQDRAGKCGYGRTGAFLLPPLVSDLIHQGEELGIATDIAFQKVNSKHGGGTVGVLTDEKITRADFYRDAIIFALIPFIKSELYTS